MQWHPRRWYSRQRLASMLYCDGLSTKQVALVLGIKFDRAKDDVDCIRNNYRAHGRPVRNRIDYRRRLIEDGYLREEAGNP